jgi:hypothetical protein
MLNIPVGMCIQGTYFSSSEKISVIKRKVLVVTESSLRKWNMDLALQYVFLVLCGHVSLRKYIPSSLHTKHYSIIMVLRTNCVHLPILYKHFGKAMNLHSCCVALQIHMTSRKSAFEGRIFTRDFKIIRQDLWTTHKLITAAGIYTVVLSGFLKKGKKHLMRSCLSVCDK